MRARRLALFHELAVAAAICRSSERTSPRSAALPGSHLAKENRRSQRKLRRMPAPTRGILFGDHAPKHRTFCRRLRFNGRRQA